MNKKTNPYRVAAEYNIPMIWEPGQVIAGLYQVEDIASGGMGVVYFVKHLKWGIRLAVKTPLLDIVRDETAMKRFIREAETWVNLGLHPHVASCYYVRKLGGVPRIFIEFVDGGSLKEWIAGGKVNGLPGVLDIAIQICRGMDYVHEQGVIHRDLKPANCLITKDGIIKITDFGLAKVGEEIREISKVKLREAGEGSISVTGAGFGTPEYMPPEQFADYKHIGREADVYSFGVMLYEMVCGRRPFVMPEGMHPAAREEFYQHVHQKSIPSEPLKLCSHCPTGLSELILKCLEKVPERRPASFLKTEEGLFRLYKQITGREYPSKKINPLKLRADTLNNKALSLLDLGNNTEAVKYWEEALRVEPAHLAATFNNGYYQSTIESTDVDFYYVNRLRNLVDLHGGEAEFWHNLAIIEAEIGLVNRARESAKKATTLGGEEENLKDLFDLLSPLVRTFEGHNDSVRSVVLAPDGKQALSGSNDETLRLWQVGTGKCIRVFEGHKDSVCSVALTPDSKYGLSGSADGTLMLWDVKTGECLRVFEGHEYSVCSVGLSPDGRHALSSSDDETVRLWDVKTGECLRVFETTGRNLHTVVFSADCRYAIFADANTVRLWEIKTGICRTAFEDIGFSAEFILLSQDGKYALSGGGGRYRGLWNVDKGERLKNIWRHMDLIALTPDGRYALSPSYDNTIRLWQLDTEKSVRVFGGHTGTVTSISISPDSRHFLSGSYDKTLRLWKCFEISRLFQYIISAPIPSSKVKERREKVDEIISVAFSLIEVNKCFNAYVLLESARKIPGYSLDGRILDLINTCGLKAGMRKNLRSSWCLGVFERYGWAAPQSAAMTYDGSRLVIDRCNQKTFRLSDLKTGKNVDFEIYTNSFCQTPDGRYSLSGGKDWNLRLWEVETKKYLGSFKGHTGNVVLVFVTPDSRYAFSGSEDKTLRLWEIETGRCLRIFEGHTDCVTLGALSPDIRYLLSAGDDLTVRVWGLEWDWEFPDPVDWDEGARPYLETFLKLRDGKWGEQGFQQLLKELEVRGYGWLNPEGVKKELRNMTQWQS